MLKFSSNPIRENFTFLVAHNFVREQKFCVQTLHKYTSIYTQDKHRRCVVDYLLILVKLYKSLRNWNRISWQLPTSNSLPFKFLQFHSLHTFFIWKSRLWQNGLMIRVVHTIIRCQCSLRHCPMAFEKIFLYALHLHRRARWDHCVASGIRSLGPRQKIRTCHCRRGTCHVL